MKWVAVALAMLGVIGIAMSAYDESCLETAYSGGRLIECESMALFQPVHDDSRSESTDVTPAGVASIALPPRLMALLGALLHGDCQSTKVPEGQWTICNDGFSLLERGRAPVAFVLRPEQKEDPVAKAERKAAAARAGEDPELTRALEQARASNEPLQARLKAIAEHEAEAERAAAGTEREQEPTQTVARAER